MQIPSNTVIEFCHGIFFYDNIFIKWIGVNLVFPPVNLFPLVLDARYTLHRTQSISVMHEGDTGQFEGIGGCLDSDN